MTKNPRVKIKRNQLWRLLAGLRVHLPSSVGLLEVTMVPADEWVPLQPIPERTVEHMRAEHRKHNLPTDFTVWSQGSEPWHYEVICHEDGQGSSYLSIKRMDRAPIHNWRHLQQIKNEVCGVEREGVEIYPAESRLADNANQYHLFVLPEGAQVPLGFPTGIVGDQDALDRFVGRPHPGKQEPWQEGLTTGNTLRQRGD